MGSAEFIPLAMVQKQKDIEPITEAVPIKETGEKVDIDTKEMAAQKKTPEPAIVKQQKEVEVIIAEETINETIQEVDLEPNDKTKEKAPEITTHEHFVEEKPVAVSPPQKPLEAGKVVITVYKATDIEQKGMFGKADPCVKMTLGNQKAKSATVKNNHNPEWNFKATFDVDQNTTQNINIAVFDDDFGKDDSLGSTLLDISKVQEHHQLLNQWIPLEKCKSGAVLLSAEFIPVEKVKQQKQIEADKNNKEKVDNSAEFATQEITKKDNQQVENIQEAVKQQHTAEKGAKGLKDILIKDKNISSKMDKQQKEDESLITTETVNINVQKMDLLNIKSKELSTQEKPTEPVLEIKPVAVSQQQKPLVAGQVVITVYKARDIEKKGMFGKADPYVKMTLGKQKAKSGTVKNNHNPEWNFKAIFDVDQNSSEGINIEVFDDDFGKDDSLGSTLLDISKVQEHHQLLNQWIPLEKCKSGAVLLSAEFIPVEKVKQQIEADKNNKEEVDNSAEFAIQEITKKDNQQVENIQEAVIQQHTAEKGAKGLKDILTKDKKISTEMGKK